MPDPIAFAATVILLLPMGYLLLAAPLLLVRLDIPPVALLLRGMFNAYFVVLAIAGAIGVIAFAIAGKPAFVVAVGLIVALAIFARRWFLKQMDAALSSAGAGEVGAGRKLRRLHWGGMLFNAIQCFAVVSSIPLLGS